MHSYQTIIFRFFIIIQSYYDRKYGHFNILPTGFRIVAEKKAIMIIFEIIFHFLNKSVMFYKSSSMIYWNKSLESSASFKLTSKYKGQSSFLKLNLFIDNTNSA